MSYQKLRNASRFSPLNWLLITLFCLGSVLASVAQTIESKYPDTIILTDGTEIKCNIISHNKDSLRLQSSDTLIKVLALKRVMTFVFGVDAVNRAKQIAPEAAAQYYGNQDYLLTQKGERKLVALNDVNSLYFVTSPLAGGQPTYNPYDSVAAFYSTKPFINNVLTDFEAAGRLYGPNQELDRVLKKPLSAGNWNADVIVKTTGEVLRVVILNVDSVNGVTYKPAFFSIQDFPASVLPWSAIRAIDYFEDPNPFTQPQWYGYAEDYREPKLKSLIARPLTGNLQFASTYLADELKETRKRHQRLFAFGGAVALIGLTTTGLSIQQLGISRKNEYDFGSVVSSSGIFAGLAITGYSFHLLYDAVLNLTSYNRMKYVNKTLKVEPTGTGLSLKYQF